MSRQNQMIGRRGEKRFSSLCSDHGVSCTKSDEDDYGWDMYLEFPARPEPAVAIDMRSGPTRTLVQIKATESSRRTVSFSLDNALRYARAELPTFVILAVLDGPATSWFATHVSAKLIAAWLFAGRKADADGVIDTNLEMVFLTFSEEDRHDDDLIPWMEQEIRSVGSDYAAWKAGIVRTVGFGPFYGSAQVTISAEKPTDFLDLQLGLLPSLKASSFTYRSERFGILARAPEIDLTDVQLSLKPEGREGVLHLRFPDGRRCSVTAAVYTATDGTSHAWRISAGCLDIVVGPERRTKVRANLAFATPCTLDELALFALLHETVAGVSIELELRLDNEALDLGSISMNSSPGAGWQLLSASVAALHIVSDLSRISPPLMPMNDLLKADSELEILAALAAPVTMGLSYIPNPEAPTQFSYFLGFCSARVGSRSFGAVAARSVLSNRMKGKRREFRFANPTVLWATIDVDPTRHRERLLSAYEKELLQLSQSGEVLALGDLRLIAGRGPGDHPLVVDKPDSDQK